jgi:hypothetical protein
MTRLRVALTISGAVALGAYEGGALAALLLAAQELCDLDPDHPVLRIDVIGGASAGSITALLAGRTLTEGLDPIQVMRQAWVVEGSLSNLRSPNADAPLTASRLRDMAVSLLEPPGSHARPRQPGDVQLRMVLATLRGLSYRIRGLDPAAPPDSPAAREEIDATTYVDWADFRLSPGTPTTDLVDMPPNKSPVDVALASGANALGFSPAGIDRSRDRALYEPRITNFPRTGWFWYTDGGTIDNEPVRRTADLADRVDRGEIGGSPGIAADERRLVMLIHPHPTAAPTGIDYADPKTRPSWTGTLGRSWKIATTQGLYADLRQLVRTNSRIRWADHARSAIGEAIDDMVDDDPKAAQRVHDALVEVVTQIRRDRATLDADEDEPALHVDAADGDVTALLGELLDEVGGLGRHQPVAVSVVSPLPLAEEEGKPVEDLLAGEFAFHFGGFLDQSLRASDFSLGYRSMSRWLHDHLGAYGLPPTAVDAALAAVDRRRAETDAPDRGEARLSSLPLHDRLAAIPLVGQYLRVVVHDAWRLFAQRRG